MGVHLCAEQQDKIGHQWRGHRPDDSAVTSGIARTCQTVRCCMYRDTGFPCLRELHSMDRMGRTTCAQDTQAVSRLGHI